MKNIFFTNERSAKGVPYLKTGCYYFRDGNGVYSDKISRFIIDCETNCNELVTNRFADIYDEIFIDEFQDLSGWDLDLLEVFLKDRIHIIISGDPRQCTYRTNNAAKNSGYHGINILDLFCQWEKNNLCQTENHAISHRCNQKICDFADLLWPNMEKTQSLNNTTTKHDGIFVVS